MHDPSHGKDKLKKERKKLIKKVINNIVGTTPIFIRIFPIFLSEKMFSLNT